MVVTVSHAGYVKRNPISLYRAQRRGGKGKTGAGTRDEDFVESLFVASTHSYLLVFSDKGKVYWLKVHEIPQAGPAARGKPIVNLVQLAQGEKVAAILPVRELPAPAGVERRRGGGRGGGGSRAAGQRDLRLRRHPPWPGEEDAARGLRPAARLRDHRALDRGGGQPHRRPHHRRPEPHPALHRAGHGHPLRGVGGPLHGARRLRREGHRPRRGRRGGERRVAAAGAGGGGAATILSVTANGYGKRTELSEYRIQSRGGKGIITIKATERNGPVVAAHAGGRRRRGHAHHQPRHAHPHAGGADQRHRPQHPGRPAHHRWSRARSRWPAWPASPRTSRSAARAARRRRGEAAGDGSPEGGEREPGGRPA